MKKIILIAIIIAFFPHQMLAQKEISGGTYLSKNKLDYIILMKNNTFGFIFYANESPYMIAEEREK